MRSKRQQTSDFAEDVTHQAGWMYADLFLALMVIFLATISFVPELSGGPASGNSNNKDSVALKSVKFDQGLANTYNGFNLEQLTADIAAFKKKNGLSESAQIIHVQVVGGYKNGEKASAGTFAAIRFSVELKQQAQDLINGASITLDRSNSVPSGSVSLRMTFEGR
jgi:hypothetical protein